MLKIVNVIVLRSMIFKRWLRYKGSIVMNEINGFMKELERCYFDFIFFVVWVLVIVIYYFVIDSSLY